MPDIFTTNDQSHASVKKRPVGLFSTFVTHPSNLSFEGQEANEEIQLFLRPHFITNLRWICIALLLALVPPAISIVGVYIPLPFVAPQHFFFLSLFYYALIFSYCFISFLTWAYNIFIVTNNRVIDIDYSQIVLHNIATTRISNIEDVMFTQAGFLSSFLNIGNVEVVTASDQRHFEALRVPSPKKAVDLISALTGKGGHGAKH